MLVPVATTVDVVIIFPGRVEGFVGPAGSLIPEARPEGSVNSFVRPDRRGVRFANPFIRGVMGGEDTGTSTVVEFNEWVAALGGYLP